MSETTMRTGLTYKVLNTGRGVYRIAAVIDTNKVVYSSNLHFVGDMYDSEEDARAALDRMLCDNMQAGEVLPMRDITQYGETIYKSKSSAMRAAKNSVGQRFLVEAPELENRFEGHIEIDESMIAVEAHEGGWRWSYTFNLADVVVTTGDGYGPIAKERFGDVCHWPDCSTPAADPVQGIGVMLGRHITRVERASKVIRHDSEEATRQARPIDITGLLAFTAACGAHGFQADNMVRRYNAIRRNIKALEAGEHLEDAAYWLEKAEGMGMDVSVLRERLEAVAVECDKTTPSTPSIVLSDLIHRIEQYRSTLRRLYDSGDFKGHSSHMASIFPVLDADCKAIGIDFRDVDTVLDIIGVTSESTNPLTIAEVVIDAEPFGLDSRVRPRLIELARLRGKLPEYYLNKVQGNLQRCAV